MRFKKICVSLSLLSVLFSFSGCMIPDSVFKQMLSKSDQEKAKDEMKACLASDVGSAYDQKVKTTFQTMKKKFIRFHSEEKANKKSKQKQLTISDDIAIYAKHKSAFDDMLKQASDILAEPDKERPNARQYLDDDRYVHDEETRDCMKSILRQNIKKAETAKSTNKTNATKPSKSDQTKSNDIKKSGKTYQAFFQMIQSAIQELKTSYEKEEERKEDEKEARATQARQAKIRKAFQKAGYKDVRFNEGGIVGLIESLERGTERVQDDKNVVFPLVNGDDAFHVTQSLEGGSYALLQYDYNWPTAYFAGQTGIFSASVLFKKTEKDQTFIEGMRPSSFGSIYVVFLGVQDYTTVMGVSKQAFVFETARVKD